MVYKRRKIKTKLFYFINYKRFLDVAFYVDTTVVQYTSRNIYCTIILILKLYIPLKFSSTKFRNFPPCPITS